MMKVIYKRDVRKEEKTESSIVRILAYFSIFQYPLSRDEIKKFLHTPADIVFLDNSLTHLVEKGSIFKTDGLYSLEPGIAIVNKRRQGNLRAEKLLPKAMRIGKFLSAFPYVRGIGISGSLSKMYADKNADIDFFIITRANRLWVARTLMHLFKKLTFLTGQQHFYCMNYYVDENALKLEDQNIYTAVETITLLPVKGESMHDFFVANSWVREWFAGYGVKQNESRHQPRQSWTKKLIERMLNNSFGDRLDNYLMNWTTRRWQKKKQKGKLNHEGKTMDLITGKHFARSNPAHFQEKVLDLYNEKIAAMKTRWPGYFVGQDFL
jgi:hypothetical protein